MFESTLFITLIAAVPILFIIWYWQKSKELNEMMQSVNGLRGPKPLPFFGNTFYMGRNTKDFYERMTNLTFEYGSPCRFFLGHELFIGLSDPRDLEVVMSNNRLLEKGLSYDLFTPWLGVGLLNSAGNRWRKHRKILTPTFHFKILEQFVEVFDANGDILMNRLKKEANGKSFDIFPYITLCALDIIAETAMGVSVNAQINKESSYVNAVKAMTQLIMLRMFKPWYRPELLFNLTPAGWKHREALKILHGKTLEVLKIKREEFKNKDSKGESPEEFGSKKKLAFLEMLLHSQKSDPTFTDEDIRQETDTFMFEGHDTTASGSSFCIHYIAKYPEVQEKIVEELDGIFQDTNRAVTYHDLQEMNYLDRVIKEAQRISGSVPFVFRYTSEDLYLKDGFMIPKGANISLMLSSVHKDPNHWPEPEKFNPDRFLPENFRERHPYAYVPFSAGPRNCIGQKYAILEIKSLLSKLLRHYKLIDVGHQPELSVESVLKSRNGIRIGLLPRKSV